MLVLPPQAGITKLGVDRIAGKWNLGRTIKQPQEFQIEKKVQGYDKAPDGHKRRSRALAKKYNDVRWQWRGVRETKRIVIATRQDMYGKDNNDKNNNGDRVRCQASIRTLLRPYIVTTCNGSATPQFQLTGPRNF